MNPSKGQHVVSRKVFFLGLNFKGTVWETKCYVLKELHHYQCTFPKSVKKYDKYYSAGKTVLPDPDKYEQDLQCHLLDFLLQRKY